MACVLAGPIADRVPGVTQSVGIDPFRIAARAVSNRQFTAFVDATGHVTSA
jgi:formylglycine-generating enzyme required for sulfatase activity